MRGMMVSEGRSWSQLYVFARTRPSTHKATLEACTNEPGFKGGGISIRQKIHLSWTDLRMRSQLQLHKLREALRGDT